VNKPVISRTLAIILLLSIAAFGQTTQKPAAKPAPIKGKLAAIHVGGTKRYTQAEVTLLTALVELILRSRSMPPTN
jgi:hypothetical protein